MGTMVKAEVTIESPWVGSAIENGKTYYLYNVKAKAFMRGGNSWGTQASFGEDAVAFTAEGSGDTYGLKSLTYGDGKYLGNGLYVDQGKKEFVFAQVGDGIYTITKDGAYLAYDGNSVVKTVAEVTDGCYWQLLTNESILTGMAAAAAGNPYAVTPLVRGANFGRNDAANSTWSGAPAIGGGDHVDNCAEKFNAGNFEVLQTLTGLPAGTYKLQAQGFYRMGSVEAAAAARVAGTENYDVKFVANDQSVTVMSVMDEAGKLDQGANYGDYGKAPNSMGDASAFFSKGYYEHEFYFTVTEERTATIGVAKKSSAGDDWVIFDNFRLTYYGTATVEEIELAKLGKFFTAVEDLVAAAEAIEATYSEGAKAELDAAIAAGKAAMGALTEEALVAAVAPLQAAIARAERSVALNAMDLAPATPATPIDMTQFVANPDMETGDIKGWTATAGWQFQNNNQFQNGDAVINRAFQERWVWNAALGNTSTEQTLLDMPNGWYSLTVSIIATRQGAEDSKAAATGVYLFAGDEKVAVATKDNTPENFTVKVQVVNNVLTLGIKGEDANANWIAFDNVSLKYLMGVATEEEFELADARAEFLSLKDKFDYFSTGIYEVMYVGRVGNAYSALSETVWALAEKEDATVEEYEACMAEMQKVMDDIVAIDAYYSSTFAPLADECFNVQDNSVATSEEVAAAFEEACDKMGWEGTENVATVADLEAIVAAVEPVLHEYVQNALPTNGYAFDYTFLAGNLNNSKDGWNWTFDKEGWEGNFAYNGNDALNTEEYKKAGYVEVWTANAGEFAYGTVSYEVEVPNGIYTVSAYASSRNVVSKFFANEESVEIAALAKYENPTIENLVVTDGKIKLGIRVDGSDWVGISNVQLSYLGDGGVTGVYLWTEETYYDEWADEDIQYNFEWDTPRFTEVGATFKFEVDVEAPEGADKTITWSVSDDKVLSIDQRGLLTVIGSGSGIYEVIATAPNGICATCEVYVEAFLAGDITEMEVTCGGEWWIEATKAGATYQLEVTYNEDATNVDLVWSSDDETVATVDQNGLVTIVGSGYTEVRVVAPSGVEASISVWVEILDDDDVDGIKSVESEAKAVIYDLQGRRVQKMEKGLYIVNGKKVLVK